MLINGKGLKSKNKHWNKRIAHLREVETAMNGYWVTTKTGKTKVSHRTKQQIALTNKRNNQVRDYCHKVSKFVQIPHAMFIDMLEYKCQKYGLNLEITEEAHTSKTSWLDDEWPGHPEKYVGKRVKRGLFRSADGTPLNADVNGALQIIRKVFPKAKADRVGAYGQPLRVNVV